MKRVRVDVCRQQKSPHCPPNFPTLPMLNNKEGAIAENLPTKNQKYITKSVVERTPDKEG